MKLVGKVVQLSAGDLTGHLACAHKTVLDEEVARGRRQAPPRYPDPIMDLLRERGIAHEAAYVASLGVAAKGARGLVTIDAAEPVDAVAATVAAMRAGAQLIVQACLASGRWVGRADVLRRVAGQTDLGPWGYEVIDTKLATETRGATVLQLCLYTALVAELQGTTPVAFHVVTPGVAAGAAGAAFVTETFRVTSYLAYYRYVRARLEAWRGGATYPDPVGLCGFCRWWQTCDAQRRDDDSLWLVAGITRGQYAALREAKVETLAGLAARKKLPVLARGAQDGLERTQLQAQQQLAGRRTGQPAHALLPVEEGRGLARLPTPSAGDLFFDIEGDRMAVAEGHEFLFGMSWREGKRLVYRGWWAFTPAEERQAFQEVMDFIAARLVKHPGAHVYHYAPYEPSALKRMMARHGTRGDELDRLLRGERLVDLCSLTRQALRASVEQYSLKDLEVFHGYARQAELRAAGACVRAVRLALAQGVAGLVDVATRAQVEAYNREDCESTLSLRGWLEALRAGAIAAGAVIARPAVKPGDPEEESAVRDAELAEVIATLVAKVPEDALARTAAQQAKWLLAQVLEYHRREAKAFWWERYRRGALSDHEALEEREAIGGLVRVGQVDASRRGLPVVRYRHPAQPHELDVDHQLLAATADGPVTLGTVRRLTATTIDVQHAGKAEALTPTVIFRHDFIDPKPKPTSIRRIAEAVIARGLRADGKYAAAVALLQRQRPKTALGGGGDVVKRACRIALALDGDVLPIQGPPGTGKTYTAVAMIRALVAAGRRVGVTATSHKVVRNVLDRVAEDPKIRCMHKVGRDEPTDSLIIREVTRSDDVVAGLAARTVDVVGGTSWLFANEGLVGAFDVLFVDEAGQLSLADTLAASPAARSLVLIGDPRQLDQPQQGTHPEGAEASALGHLFGDAAVIPADAGIFLAETRRLAPAINAFTSEVFYEGRLEARAENAGQQLVGKGPLTGAGLWYRPVAHLGCQSSSEEEVAVVAALCREILDAKTAWLDVAGHRATLRGEDILVVAPYNVQVRLLSEALDGTGVRIGTVDKFQGQEAPVAIYTMTTSTPQDAPRGMEFLYSANRLNVATSRARCASVLVASPRLFEASCETPRQIALANAFCRYLELARVLGP
jgi:uncharacterized protein